MPPPSAPRINADRLLRVVIAGQIAHPVARAGAYRIGYDGRPRVLPGTGGIVLNARIGDLCVGLAGDHIEPGVALHNNSREVIGPSDGPNNALLTYACVGNAATVVSGPMSGQMGIVTGKHGGVNHVLVDFPDKVLRGLRIGDRVQIVSHGLGLRLTDHPHLELSNCSPALLCRWGLRERGRRLEVPVTHMIPARLLGSGLGKNTAWRGDSDIQLADDRALRRYRLGSLRFGDFVAIFGADTRHGPHYRTGHVAIGIVVHGDSTVAGHGPGVASLITGPVFAVRPVLDSRANLAAVFGIRNLAEPRPRVPLVQLDGARRRECEEGGDALQYTYRRIAGATGGEYHYFTNR